MLRAGTSSMTLLLAAMAAMAPLSTDMYLASLPSMTQAFGASVGDVQLTLSVYLLGFSFSQLIYGPLADRFGRKPVLIGGLLLYGASGMACATATSIEALLALRFLQSLGACSGPVLSRAMVRDLYGRQDAARAMSQMSSAMAFMPLLGPVIGSYLTLWFGWPANFIVMGSYGFAGAVVVWLVFAESIPQKDPHALRPSFVLRNLTVLLRDRVYLGYTLACCFAYGGLFSFISASSFVLIGFFGVAQQHFGFFFAMTIVGFLLGTIISSRMSRRASMGTTVALGGTLCALSGLAMAGAAWAGIDHLAAVMGPMFVFMVGIGIVMPQSQAAAVIPYPQQAGIASALVGFLQFGSGAVVGAVVGQLHDGTQIPMTTAIAVMGVGTLLSYWLLVGRRRPAVA